MVDLLAGGLCHRLGGFGPGFVAEKVYCGCGQQDSYGCGEGYEGCFFVLLFLSCRDLFEVYSELGYGGVAF